EWGGGGSVGGGGGGGVGGGGGGAGGGGGGGCVGGGGGGGGAALGWGGWVGEAGGGTVLSAELVIEQLEILPSQQIRSMREYAVSFANLVNGSGSANAEAIDDLSEAGRKLTEGLRSIFQRK